MSTMPRQKPGLSKQDYRTPPDFLTAVKRRLGIAEFKFDFAADATNTVAEAYWSKEVDALRIQPHVWALMASGTNQTALGLGAGRFPELWGWLNPPYANIAMWARACYEMKLCGGQVAFLVPAAVGANWYLSYVHEKALVLALNGRLSFDGVGPYPKDLILALYSPHLDPGFDVWRWRDWV
jgi:hypothetical protein